MKTKADTYKVAVVAIAASSLINSSAGVLVRHVEAANEWQIIAFRGIGVTLGLTLIFCIHERGRILASLRGISGWLLLGGLFQSAASICYIHAIQNTTIANALFVLSASPLATAVLAWFFLNERVSRGTWIAMLVAGVGIILMVRDGLSHGTGFGNLMALIAMVCFSAFVVVLRRGRATNMLPVVVVSWLVSFCVGAGMANGNLFVPLNDALLVLFWGGVVSSLVYVLFTFGSRHVLGAEVTLLVQVEFVLGPVWVWLFVGEVPSQVTLVGGLIVLAAVTTRGLAMAKRK